VLKQKMEEKKDVKAYSAASRRWSALGDEHSYRLGCDMLLVLVLRVCYLAVVGDLCCFGLWRFQDDRACEDY